ncbi:hypothetical protein L218DRAFT_901405 [Marasmius fiardii PR-910]|nr:hypothetical protein L218DRAFT_901405 [Marasmius fiardii PR-910]
MTAQVETIELSSSDSQICSVSVYGSRAELVRSYKFSVKKGQNQAHIQWLPWVMDTESFRVEGKGPATILDVKLLQNKQPSQAGSPELGELELKKTHVEMAIERCKYSITSLKTYLGSLNTQHTKANELISVVEHYDTAAAQQDRKLVELQQQLKEVESAIQAEKKKLSPKDLGELGRQAFVGLIADADADVELVLKYAVNGAKWSAVYDVRVDTNLPEKPVALIYKAIISQNTNESWDDVPVTLETVTPTHGVALPSLSKWTVSLYTPPPPAPRVKQTARRASTHLRTAEAIGDSDEDMGFGLFDDDEMDHAVADISSKGSLSTAFRVPGLVTIPSGNTEQTFTIVELQLDARITWFTIPKVDTRVHLKADVHNGSAYTLLPGNANVYVDGSFISKSRIPSVSPLEHFDCALGVDPSVRITYHPIQKNTSTTGFYTKWTNHVYVQRLTIENTRTNSVPLIKVVDQIPVSENSQVVVKLVAPALKSAQATAPPVPSSSSSNGSQNKSSDRTTSTTKQNSALACTLDSVIAASAGPNVKVAEGVYALWDGADEREVDLESLGKSGKVSWLCEVRAQEKVNFVLRWEVGAPSKAVLTGM